MCKIREIKKNNPSYRRNQASSSLFETAQTLESLSKQGNPLEFVSRIVDFEMFRSIIESKLQTAERKSNAGRHPIDPVLMFKVMFVQRLYGLSDEQAEYQIKDRMSFRDFLGILTVDDIPDARTIWKYREDLTRCGAYDGLFKRFYEHLQSFGLIVNEGKIIDASFVVSPRQRNTREENNTIRKGEGAGYVGTDDGFTNRGITPMICEKGFRGHPLNEEQKQNNRSKPKIRSRVEYVFGFIERSMGGLVFRGVGIVRAKANVAMTNLTYNIARLTQIYSTIKGG